MKNKKVIRSAKIPTMRVLMMPKDTNHQGVIFGGVILSYIDQSGFIEAKSQSDKTFVTASIDKVDFVEPVYSGDIVSFYTSVVKIGTASIQIKIDVYVDHVSTYNKPVLATTAKATYVAIDPRNNKPTPILK